MWAFAFRNHGLGFGHGEKGRPLDVSILDATHPRSFVTGSINEHQTSDGTKPITKIMYRGVNSSPGDTFSLSREESDTLTETARKGGENPHNTSLILINRPSAQRTSEIGRLAVRCNF